jgi:hypothetical protein
MKWRHETRWVGQRRQRKAFAFLPRRLNDGYTVWLEFYLVEETYKDHKGGTGWCFLRATRP